MEGSRAAIFISGCSECPMSNHERCVGRLLRVRFGSVPPALHTTQSRKGVHVVPTSCKRVPAHASRRRTLQRNAPAAGSARPCPTCVQCVTMRNVCAWPGGPGVPRNSKISRHAGNNLQASGLGWRYLTCAVSASAPWGPVLSPSGGGAGPRVRRVSTAATAAVALAASPAAAASAAAAWGLPPRAREQMRAPPWRSRPPPPSDEAAG